MMNCELFITFASVLSVFFERMQEQISQTGRQPLLPVGTLLQGGRYRIDGHLSSGGFGNTYVATNMEYGVQVAIKEFSLRDTVQNEDDTCVVVRTVSQKELFAQQRAKFRKEANRMHQLHNEHIVNVYQLFEENGTAYYEMDLIHGESLDERLKRSSQPLDEREVVGILDQVLDGLAAVHEQHLVHLDLKPANIMMDERERAMLIDFGASKHVSDGQTSSVPSMMLFTPQYSPLEQIDQNLKNFGPWTDFYALGATLYRLLTLQSPPTATERLEERAELTFPPHVSAPMQSLIAWMMQLGRMDRPQNTSEIKQYLYANFQSYFFVAPAPEPAYVAPPQPAKKTPTCLIVLAFVLALVLTVILLLVFLVVL